MKLIRNPILLVLLILASSALFAQSAAAAKTGTLAVSLDAAPKKARRADRSVDIRAIKLGSGVVAAARRVSAASAKLKLAPGAYVVSARVTTIPGKVVEGTGIIVAVKAGRTTKQRVKARALNVKFKKRKARKSKRKKMTAIPDEYFAPASESAGRYVVGIDPAVKVDGLAEYPKGLPIDGVLATPISKRCPGGQPAFDLVEIRRRDELKAEIDLAQTEYFDKSTAPKKGRWLRERQMIRGSGTVAGGRVTVSLTFEDIATGQVIATGAAEGRETDTLDVIDAAAEALMKNICAGRVDVTFTGSGTYKRDEGTSATDLEQHVSANTNWSITYKNVPLAGNGEITFASASEVTGSWTTDGRYGAQGPGNFTCSAPVVGYAGLFSMARAARSGSSVRLTLPPYFNVQGDYQNKSCSGLPGPPFAAFVSSGHDAAHSAVVDFAVEDLASAGKLIFNVGPTTVLPPDCSDLLGDFEAPCSQSSSWSGQVTVMRAGV